MGAPFPHFIASFPVNSDTFFTSAYMKLLPPRTAHSYQQDSQNNTAGPLNLQGEPPQQSSRDWPSSSQQTPHSTWRADGMDWWDLSHHFPQPLKRSSDQSSLQQHHPSSLQFLGYQCKDMWRKEMSEGSWIRNRQHLNRLKTHVLHIHCLHFGKTLESDWLWCDCMIRALTTTWKILKKNAGKMWLKFRLSWGKGEGGTEVGWFQAHGHGWITSYQTKARYSIGPLTGTWSMSTFKALKEGIPSMPLKVKLFF